MNDINLNAYIASERLYRGTFDPTTSPDFQIDWRNIQPSRGPLNGYVKRVLISMSGQIVCNETQPAALPAYIFWSWLARVSLQGEGHVFLDRCPGYALFSSNYWDRFLDLDNDDYWVSAPIEPAQGEVVNIAQSWIIDLAPLWWDDDRKDGIWPLAMMGAQGDLRLSLNNPLDYDQTYEWVDETANLIVDVECYWTPDVILSSPWRVDTNTSNDSVWLSPSREGKCDMLLMLGQDADVDIKPITGGAFTFKVDGLIYQDTLTLDEQIGLNSVHMPCGVNNAYDMGHIAVVWPNQATSFADFPAGRVFKLDDLNQSANKSRRYFIRRHITLSAEVQAALLASLGKKINPAREPQRFEMGGKPAVETPLNRDRQTGLQLKVR